MERDGIFAGDDPLVIAQRWLDEATETEINDPNAMALATSDAQAMPNVRMVLLKEIADPGFVFYTNYNSAKGAELDAQPMAAGVLHWKSLRRQLRVRGHVSREDGARADEYYASRALRSRLGAWASEQSRPLASRASLISRGGKGQPATRTAAPSFVSTRSRCRSGWSQVASDVLAQKYFRKAGVPNKLERIAEDGVPDFLWRSRPAADNDGFGGETSARQVFDRLAGAWTYWGWQGGYFSTEADARAYFDEMRVMLARQMAAPNSPQWFNTGLHWAYGIDGPGQGHYYVDHATGKLTRSKSAYEHPQPHACFIQSVKDDLVGDGGIMDLWVREARLFKYGSGTGTNFSSLRAEGEKLSGGGKSSGLMGFLKIGDRAAGAIKSGGTTRRAAKMVICDADHPDIEEFINWKVKEEQKVASIVAGSKAHEAKLNEIFGAIREWDGSTEDAVDPKTNATLATAIRGAKKAHIPETYVKRVLDYAKQGYGSIEFPTYDTDWDSEAYASVSGQNSNNSIRVTDAFLEAVRQDADWALINRTDGSVAKTLKARDLWEDVGHAAWACADPGIQYHDTVNAWHTCPEDGEIRASNPCSEYMFLDDTACNLASMNLLKFYDGEAFDAEGYMHATRLWTVTLEISVLMAQFPSKEIARRSFEFRTLGLGYANIGGLLMNMGFGYDSREGRALGGALTAIMTGVSYATSAEMAGEIGAFAGYEKNAEHMLRVIRNHRRAAHGETDGYEGLAVRPVPLDHAGCPEPRLNALAKGAWDEALSLGERHGYRNAQATVIAPTGTIGLVMDCDTTGIEPDFALVKFKKLAGGGYFKIINQSVPAALAKLGYRPAQIEEIVATRSAMAALATRRGSIPPRSSGTVSARRSWRASKRRSGRPSTSASCSTSGRSARISAPACSASRRRR